MSDYPVLPDGSSFFTASYPLPKDHWIYDKTCFNELSPIKDNIVTRERVIHDTKIAIQKSTNYGKEMDFDPDAVIQNLSTLLFGNKNDVI